MAIAEAADTVGITGMSMSGSSFCLAAIAAARNCASIMAISSRSSRYSR